MKPTELRVILDPQGVEGAFEVRVAYSYGGRRATKQQLVGAAREVLRNALAALEADAASVEHVGFAEGPRLRRDDLLIEP